MLYLDICFVISTNFANLLLYSPPPPKKNPQKTCIKDGASIEHSCYILLQNVTQTHTDGKVKGG